MMIPLQLMVVLAVLISAVKVQENCEDGSCYPSIGDLLVGRSEHLSASSTCGLNGPQKYCIISYLECKPPLRYGIWSWDQTAHSKRQSSYCEHKENPATLKIVPLCDRPGQSCCSEDDQKCFKCDSRFPYNPYSNSNSHLIENIITTFESDWKKKWWQSENGVDHVSIRLDLETLFQFSHLVLTFKTFRPAAMLVERSRDYGKTWKVFRYFAQNCESSFPEIPQGHADEVGDVVCDSRYSSVEPSTEGEIILKALDPTFHIDDPYDPYIQDLITITNLRVNFTKLHTLGDTMKNWGQNGPEEKYYYAIYEMIVRGSCFCNGHARHCVPVQNMQGYVFNQPGMVHGKCVCQHNTDGLNCEKCKEFYNDAPWRPAAASDDNACRKCNCNGHSEKCHFDMAVYLASDRASGGVCEDCQHNTMGNHCELCKPYFYRNPLREISDPFACVSCDCNPDGTQDNGLCESHTDPRFGIVAGTCLCKENVEGFRCDECKAGYFGLSAIDPLGCQYCNCNPFGSVPFSVCDSVTGECQCQRFVTGRYCEECIPGFWGLGNTLYSCAPCNCDIGGARSNLCSQSNGQCDCLPNIIGRQCNQPKPGYYFVPLDYYFYEAENAQLLSKSASIVKPTSMPKCKDYFLQQGIDFRYENGKIILTNITREKAQLKEGSPFTANGVVEIIFRQPTPDNPVTWTGPGFARVLDGTGLRFTVNNIPFPMDFIIAIRYEPESLEDWTARVVVNSPQGAVSDRCKNRKLMDDRDSLHLSATSRLALLNTSICADPETEYLIDVYFTKLSNFDDDKTSYILIDSLGLIPQIASVNNLCSKLELDEYDQYNCIEMASEIGTEILPDVCESLIVSMSARIHNGAVECACNENGSLSTNCSKFGGQCECKPNVVGRCCDRCAVGSYGFSPCGCKGCHCHSEGSFSTLCDQVTGQCACRSNIYGRRCDRCLPGYYGFPNCQPCQCNGKAELCDSVTGDCLDCKEFTNGTNCERCVDNYFGNPILGQPCRPCMCPDSPTSNRYFAHSCHQDPDSLEMVCSCLDGYTGKNCNECPVGHYGNIEETGEPCLPCQCNNNTDVTDPESCDNVTGECLKCLYNTYGENCESCLPGYFGSPQLQNCRKCVCNPMGTNIDTCSIYEEVGECVCNKTTGQCPCLPNVTGISCDKCASGYWGMVSGNGCQPCDCYLNNSYGNQCNQFTGQCLCKPRYKGKKCDECDENYYGNPKVKCIPCNCNLEGTLKPLCDKETGSCNCKVGVTGRFCDQCAPKFVQQFPECPRCHQCFDYWDTEVTSLSDDVHGFVRLAANIGPNKSQLGCDVQMTILQDKILTIEKIFQSPILSPQQYAKVKSYYDNIRQKVRKIIVNDVGEFNEIPKMNKTMRSMEEDIDNLFKKLDTIRKNKEKENAIKNKAFIELFDKISKHYETSLSTAGKSRNASLITRSATKTRKHVITVLDNIDTKHKLNSDKLNKMKSLDISKMNEMVCGTVWDFPCDIAPCGGALCRDKFGKRKCGGTNCNGALPLAKDALKTANETDINLNKVAIHLLEAEKQIENIRRLAEDTKLKAAKLDKTLSKAKTQIEADKKRSKELIQHVKDFLLDSIPVYQCPGSSVQGGSIPKIPQEVDAMVSPEEIENVANQILAIKLPAAPYDLIDMLNKIKKYCDDYKKNKQSLQNQLDEVKKLTLRAKEAKKQVENLPNGDVIRKTLKLTETTQKNTASILKSINNDIQDIRNKLSKAKTKADMTDDKLKAIKDLHSQLETKIAELQDKMLQNRKQASDAHNGAKAALKEAIESENALDNLKEKYDFLKEKLKKKEIPPEILERLQLLKKEAEGLAKEIDNKFKRISDLEQKIDELNIAKQDKEDKLKELEEQVIELKDEIHREEAKHSTCKA